MTHTYMHRYAYYKTFTVSPHLDLLVLWFVGVVCFRHAPLVGGKRLAGLKHAEDLRVATNLIPT